jgi:superfamily I DNA and RNA helicase
MINIMPSADYENDIASQTIWKWIQDGLQDEEGVCYYKDTLVESNTGTFPELVIYSRSHQPLIIHCLPYLLDEIEEVSEDLWVIKGEEIDSPILELQDFKFKLKSKFVQDRILRQKVNPEGILALPLIAKQDFRRKFDFILDDISTVWVDRNDLVIRNLSVIQKSDLEWRTVRSIAQGVRPLRTGLSGHLPNKKQTIGEAIKELEKQIALLDTEQEKAAKQIAPGIQRIRGLAGTGKTVLLAMRAAEIHRRYPDKKILFTFNTQSLYNQARKLITQFYRFRVDEDPDWDKLHVRHAWGGRNRPGVYFEICERQGVIPLSFSDVKGGKKQPFQIVCQSALTRQIKPEYDFILVDEAQDFPNEYFQVLLKLSYSPHQICYAYDELQSLYNTEIPKSDEMFGFDDQGKPYVTFDGEDYPGGIEKEFVLHRSYRCPQPVLMLAHALGLGLYNPHGCVQMLEKEESWQSLGYEIKAGKLEKGEVVEIFRPNEHSPNQITEIYNGEEDLVVTKVFNDRAEELIWIAESITNDIRVEKVAPDQIIVISLDSKLAKDYMSSLQIHLVNQGIPSNIPGSIDDKAAFMEPGKVTLSTINRAKGNEAPIVYILSFESLYDYVDSVENRNKAFTSISRSKAWVRITGVGRKMKQAQNEVEKIRLDYPSFKFVFPDMEAIRKLDAQTVKRRRQVDKAKATTADLLNYAPEVLEAIAKSDPKMVQELLKRLKEVAGENK